MNIFENIEDEFYPNGCSVIFRKSEIPQPFDSDYFFYSEDLYLGLKARFMDMKIIFVKGSVIHHIGGGAPARSAYRTFYQERNRMLNLYTFFSISFVIRIFPIILFVNSAKFISALFSRNTSFWGTLRAHIWLCLHISAILNKRKALKKIKKVDEREVIKSMTSKVLNHENTLNKLINNAVYYYSRVVGIEPIEHFQKLGGKLIVIFFVRKNERSYSI